jgi:hypothetical protein
MEFKDTILVKKVSDDEDYTQLVIPRTHTISYSKSGNGDEQRTVTHVVKQGIGMG